MGSSSKSRTSANTYNQQQDRKIQFGGGSGNFGNSGNIKGSVNISTTDHGAVEGGLNLANNALGANLESQKMAFDFGGQALELSSEANVRALDGVETAYQQAQTSNRENTKVLTNAFNKLTEENDEQQEQSKQTIYLIAGIGGLFAIVAIFALVKK